MKSILLIEDDPSLRLTLSENLERVGYHVDTTPLLREGVKSLLAGAHDLLILDVMLPDGSGIEALKDIRKTSSIPTLIISAKSTSSDRIVGLEAQADDYLGKPFHLKEFLLRVDALLRRSKDKDPVTQISIGQKTVVFDKYEIRSPGDPDLVKLTVKEARVLRVLATERGSVVSRESLIRLVWGRDQSPSTRTVDNVILKLRRYLEPDPAKPMHILSHRGAGYSLREDS